MMRLQALEQRVKNAFLAGTLGGSLLLSGCAVGPDGTTALQRFATQRVPQQDYSPSYSAPETAEAPLLVDYMYYEPSSGSSDLNLLSFILSLGAFGAAQRGFIPQSAIMDVGSAAVGRQAIITGQKEMMQQGRSLYWPGSKPGFLITHSRQFGVTWTIAYKGFADNGDGKPQIEEFLGTGNSFQSNSEFEVGCLVEHPLTNAHCKIFNEKNEVVLTSKENAPYGTAAHINAGTLKPGVYFASFYGQVPYVKPTWHSGPPSGIVGRDYILGNIQFEVTP